MGNKRAYSGLEATLVAGVPAVCTFLYDWRIGVAWFVFAILAGYSKNS